MMSEEYPETTVGRVREIILLRDQVERLTTESSDLRQRCAILDAGSPPEGWEALERQIQWEIAFGAALLAVEAEFTSASSSQKS